jgi:2-polyprenyl-6-methoxyphenol hydroxylase-like FAD-dependent oxidoreductase
MPDMLKRTDVLIVGAGPSGLTLACGLARAGVSLHLIDKLSERLPHSRALVVHLRSLEIFDQLGMADELLPLGNNVAGGRIHFAGKRPLNVRFFEQSYAGCRFRAALFIEQEQTEAALDRCLDRLGHRVHFGHELIGFDEQGEQVHASCLDEDNRKYRVECRYIVGCDGAHSVVRSQKNIPFLGSAYPQDFILADVDLMWDEPRDLFQIFIDRHGFLAMLPMRTKSRLISARGRYRVDAPEPSMADFQTLVAQSVPQKAKISDPVWLTRFHLHHRIAERYIAGRVCLVGDAAHIHSPVGGQGMNTGIQDAWNLAWKLVWALRCGDARQARELLASYHEERYPVGKRLIRTTDRAFNFVSGRSWLSQLVRACIGPWVVPKVAGLDRVRTRALFLLTQLGINYRGSKLCGPDAGGRIFKRGLVSGDRMPNISVGGVTLHGLLHHTKPTILAVGARPREDLGDWPVVCLLQPALDVRRLLHVKDRAFFLIRPDGHLAARATTPEGLMQAKLGKYWAG